MHATLPARNETSQASKTSCMLKLEMLHTAEPTVFSKMTTSFSPLHHVSVNILQRVGYYKNWNIRFRPYLTVSGELYAVWFVTVIQLSVEFVWTLWFDTPSARDTCTGLKTQVGY